MVESLPGGPVAVLCDKHGGRDRYLPLLMECFPEPLIEMHGESRRQSVYRFGPAEHRVEIRFQAKAEAHLPAALASMAAKYLRELAMRALERFLAAAVCRGWRHGRLSPGCRPIQGPDRGRAKRIGHRRPPALEDEVMDLYIIRHAWAGHYRRSGLARRYPAALDDEGRERFARMVDQPGRSRAGAGADRHRVRWCAASRRPACWPRAWRAMRKSSARDELLPGGSLAELLAWTVRQTAHHQQIAWVGHAPDVGQ